MPWLNKDGNEIPDEERLEKTESLRILKQDQSRATENDRQDAETNKNSLNKTESSTLAKVTTSDWTFDHLNIRMISAVMLVNAATYSVADLKRAQQTERVTLALKRCFEHRKLDSTPWKCKEQGDEGYLLDPEFRKIVNDSCKQCKGELYPQGILCCRRKPEDKVYHDAT